MTTPMKIPKAILKGFIPDRNADVGFLTEDIELGYEYLLNIHNDKVLCRSYLHVEFLIYLNNSRRYNFRDKINLNKSFKTKLDECVKSSRYSGIYITIFTLDVDKFLKKNIIDDIDHLIYKFNIFNISEVINWLIVKTNNRIKNISSYHTNLVLIDSVKKEAEYFEPYGDIVEVDNDDVKKVREYIKRLLSNYEIILYEPWQFCPKKGFQKIHESVKEDKYKDPGYCTTWSLWYMDMRLMNGHLSRNELINNIIDYLSTVSGKDMHIFISEYWYALTRYIDKRKKGLTPEVSFYKVHKKGYREYDDESKIAIDLNLEYN